MSLSQKQPKEEPANGVDKTVVPDPEVVPRKKRSRFTASCKLRIVEHADQLGPGEPSNCVRQAIFWALSSHLDSVLRMALMMPNIFRMQATIATLGAFPFATSRS